MVNFGARIRIEREGLRLTLDQLAVACGVAMKTVQRYETTEREPDAGFLAACEALGMDVMFILTGVRGRQTKVLDADQQRRLAGRGIQIVNETPGAPQLEINAQGMRWLQGYVHHVHGQAPITVATLKRLADWGPESPLEPMYMRVLALEIEPGRTIDELMLYAPSWHYKGLRWVKMLSKTKVRYELDTGGADDHGLQFDEAGLPQPVFVLDQGIYAALNSGESVRVDDAGVHCAKQPKKVDDDAALWRSVARGITTAPGVNGEELMKLSDVLRMIENAYLIELGDGREPPATKTKPKVK